MSFKKSLCVAISITILITIFSILPCNYASGATVYDSAKISYSGTFPTKSSEVFNGLGASVVAGNPKIQYSESLDKGATWGDYITTSASYIDQLYDGATDKDMLGSGFKGWASHDGTAESGKSGIITEYHCGDNASNKRYRYDIIYDLKGSVPVKDILIVNASFNGQSSILRMGHYAIFASNSIDTLFNSENQVFEFKNGKGAKVPLSQRITFNTAESLRYVAARVYNPYDTDDFATLAAHNTTKHQTNCYVRLLEFNIFGTNTDFTIKRQLASTQSSYTPTLQSKKNLIKGDRATKTFLYRDTNISDSTKGSEYNLFYFLNPNEINATYLTDNNCDSSLEIKGKSPDESKGYFSRESTSSSNGYLNEVIDNEAELYYQFNYKLDGAANISGLALIGHHSPLLTPSHFKFSIANSEDDLFKDTATYNSPDLYSAANINELTFTKAKMGSYVGFRIICGVTFDSETITIYQKNQLYLRMSELCVYGTYKEYVGSLTQYSKIAPLNDKVVNAPASIEYLANPDTNGRYPKNSAVNVKAQVSVRDDRDLYRFLYWIDNTKNGAIISESLALENITLPKNITAVYGTKEVNDTVAYTFTDKDGNVLYTASVEFGDYLARKDYENANALVPDIAGYQRQEETIKIGSRITTAQMWSSDVYNVPAEADITVSPLYKVSDETYTVSSETNPVPFDTKITLSASKNWYVNNVIWQKSVSQPTDTYVAGDMVITEGSSSDKVISLYDPSGKNSPTLQSGNFTAFTKLNLSSSNVLVECGVIYLGDTPDLATDSNFTIANSAQKIVATNPEGNHFSCTLKGVGKNRTRYARAYVTYRSSRFSISTTTKYSNIICITTK